MISKQKALAAQKAAALIPLTFTSIDFSYGFT
jgi:hypothetical protein